MSREYEKALFPVPVALLTFRSGTGLPRFVSANWLGMGCERPVVLSAAFRAAEQAMGDLRSEGRFAVNLLPEELQRQDSFCRILAEAAGDLLAAPDFSLCGDAQSAAPLITECPIRIECRTTGQYTLFDQQVVRGEVVAVHLEGARFSCDEEINFHRLAPLATSSRRSAFNHSSSLPG